ncbi:MAG: HprK-related kinase B [Thiotrichales bacterium]|nr:MAG: HprK-related kinase B [Thiotrichales bacterium]
MKQLLTGESELQADSLCLKLLDYSLRVRSNSVLFMQRMRDYFSHVLVPSCDHARAQITAIDRDIVDAGIEFVDWKREPGKTGRKDAIHDFSGGRLVQKVRTGMLFLQSDHDLIAAGPCLDYDNQVINFINSQFLNWLQHDGYVLCHASALSRNGKGLAIAGLSGGGKSTLMLNLLEDDVTRFVTNDRLLVRRQPDETHAVGIPKLPRINPGTIVNNPRLFPLIDEASRAQLLQLDKDELWKLEDKYDAHIGELYGRNRIQHETGLRRFLVLNWKHGAAEKLDVKRVDLDRRPDLLAAIMKPSGPFYVDARGYFNRDDNMPEADIYLQALADIEVFEASGCVDFEALGTICHEQLMD